MRPAQIPAGAGEVVIGLSGITKSFPGVVANDDVSLELRAGRVHALLGENGSGKSTLIGMLAGLQQPDAGVIGIDGRETRIASPADSRVRGIGIVHQHSTLVETMSVLENMLLVERGGFLLDRSGASRRLAELTELLGAQIEPRATVASLGLGQRQQLEIVRALWDDPRVLVLDEPTSMLTPEGAEQLLANVRRLAGHGIAVLLVTHKLHEAFSVAHEVTVLRRGRVTGRIAAEDLAGLDADAATEGMLAAMFGDAAAADAAEAPAAVAASAAAPAVAAVADAAAAVARPAGAADRDRPVPPHPQHTARIALRLDRVSTGDARTAVDPNGGTPVSDISLEVRAGEMLGIAGIDGHGQRHLVEVIAGQRPCASGRILLDGAEIERRSVRARQHLGLRTITDDRLHEGVVGSLPVALNLVLKRIGERPFWRRGRIRKSEIAANARSRIEEYDVRPADPSARAGALSGGNIQKLLLARELADDPSVLVVNKPTYGLDLRTVNRVHETLREFVARGGAALVISTDIDELLSLCSRIAVLSGGRIVGEVENDDRALAAERVARLMTGAAA